MSRRPGIATLVARGVAAVRAHLGVVLALYGLQLAVALTFTFGAALAMARLYAERPLFARGVGGDPLALMLAISEHSPLFTALTWFFLALVGAWALASLALHAGLLGALAGKGFAATVRARAAGFVRLALWSILPWLVVLVAAFVGLRVVGVRDSDLVSWRTIIGPQLLGLAPALLLAAIVCLAVDLARAELVRGGGGSARALWLGLRRAVTRPTLFAHFLGYVAVWLGISALYVAGTFGRELPGAAGAWLLFFVRQATALARFLARATTSAGQLAALELDVLEVREVVEGAEPRRDVVQGELAQPVQREALDRE